MNPERTDLDSGGGKAPPDGAAQKIAYLQAGAALGAGVIGLTAYLYLLGGTVMWLRMTAARIPADDAMDAFQNRQLLSTGLKALFFEFLLFGAVALVVWATWRVACWLERRRVRRVEESEGDPESFRDKPLDEYVLLVLVRSVVLAVSAMAVLVSAFSALSEANAVLLVAGAIALGLVIGAVDIADRRPGWVTTALQRPWVRGALQVLRVVVSVGVVVVALAYMAAPLGLTVLVLLVLVQFSDRLMWLQKVPTMKHLIVPVLILAAALNVVIVTYLATPPVTFDRATVMTTGGDEIVGAYVGRSSDGVYLGTCRAIDPHTSREAHLVVIPAAEVKELTLGGFRYSFDFGKRPSILGLVNYYTQAASLSSEDDRFSLDLRQERDVCGVNSP
jgi:hypothetical protein